MAFKNYLFHGTLTKILEHNSFNLTRALKKPFATHYSADVTHVFYVVLKPCMEDIVMFVKGVQELLLHWELRCNVRQKPKYGKCFM